MSYISEAPDLINTMSQAAESKMIIKHSPLADFLEDNSTAGSACDKMMGEFEKDYTSQEFMIDLVGEYLDHIVETNDLRQV